MQLNPAPTLTPSPTPSTGTGSLRLALAAATGCLLAGVGAHPALAQNVVRPQPSADATPAKPAAVPWQIDSAVLLYAEGDSRVRAVEPMIGMRRTDGDDHTLAVRLTLDALTGASPNGAAPQPNPQTFTSPSGESSYTVPAGKAPLDSSFKDTRGAINVGYDRPWGENRRLSVGGNVSAEYDFKSFGFNTSLAQDFNQKNTTLSVGVAGEYDLVNAVGGTPQGLSVHAARARIDANQTRQSGDLLLGLTQVMNRRWLMQFNLDLGRSSGYHSDPYKLLSVVNGATGLLSGDQYLSENRPNSRSRTSLFWLNKLHLDSEVLELSWRHYRDDWGVRANTVDGRWRHQYSGGVYIEPHLRLYKQGAADFYRGWLVDGVDHNSTSHQAQLQYASADPRLAAFSAQTLGLKLGMPVSLPMGLAGEFSVRLESYRQKLKQPANAPGYLATVPISPDLKAIFLMAGYSFVW
jgi:Protein of unknown function (DUF3570)